jgi:hypothetical protein
MAQELQEILGIMQVNCSKRYPPKQYMRFALYFLAESAWLDI